MLDKIEVIEKTKACIDVTTELFYQNKKDEGFKKLNELVEYLLNVHQILTELNAQGKCSKESIDDVLKILQQLLGAIDEKDSVLIADILQYELSEKLDEIKNM